MHRFFSFILIIIIATLLVGGAVRADMTMPACSAGTSVLQNQVGVGRLTIPAISTSPCTLTLRSLQGVTQIVVGSLSSGTSVTVRTHLYISDIECVSSTVTDEACISFQGITGVGDIIITNVRRTGISATPDAGASVPANFRFSVVELAGGINGAVLFAVRACTISGSVAATGTAMQTVEMRILGFAGGDAENIGTLAVEGNTLRLLAPTTTTNGPISAHIVAADTSRLMSSIADVNINSNVLTFDAATALGSTADTVFSIFFPHASLSGTSSSSSSSLSTLCITNNTLGTNNTLRSSSNTPTTSDRVTAAQRAEFYIFRCAGDLTKFDQVVISSNTIGPLRAQAENSNVLSAVALFASTLVGTTNQVSAVNISGNTVSAFTAHSTKSSVLLYVSCHGLGATVSSFNSYQTVANTINGAQLTNGGSSSSPIVVVVAFFQSSFSLADDGSGSGGGGSLFNSTGNSIRGVSVESDGDVGLALVQFAQGASGMTLFVLADGEITQLGTLQSKGDLGVSGVSMASDWYFSRFGVAALQPSVTVRNVQLSATTPAASGRCYFGVVSWPRRPRSDIALVTVSDCTLTVDTMSSNNQRVDAVILDSQYAFSVESSIIVTRNTVRVGMMTTASSSRRVLNPCIARFTSSSTSSRLEVGTRLEVSNNKIEFAAQTPSSGSAYVEADVFYVNYRAVSTAPSAASASTMLSIRGNSITLTGNVRSAEFLKLTILLVDDTTEPITGFGAIHISGNSMRTIAGSSSSVISTTDGINAMIADISSPVIGLAASSSGSSPSTTFVFSSNSISLNYLAGQGSVYVSLFRGKASDGNVDTSLSNFSLFQFVSNTVSGTTMSGHSTKSAEIRGMWFEGMTSFVEEIFVSHTIFRNVSISNVGGSASLRLTLFGGKLSTVVRISFLSSRITGGGTCHGSEIRVRGFEIDDGLVFANTTPASIVVRDIHLGDGPDTTNGNNNNNANNGLKITLTSGAKYFRFDVLALEGNINHCRVVLLEACTTNLAFLQLFDASTPVEASVLRLACNVKNAWSNFTMRRSVMRLPSNVPAVSPLVNAEASVLRVNKPLSSFDDHAFLAHFDGNSLECFDKNNNNNKKNLWCTPENCAITFFVSSSVDAKGRWNWTSNSITNVPASIFSIDSGAFTTRAAIVYFYDNYLNYTDGAVITWSPSSRDGFTDCAVWLRCNKWSEEAAVQFESMYNSTISSLTIDCRVTTTLTTSSTVTTSDLPPSTTMTTTANGTSSPDSNSSTFNATKSSNDASLFTTSDAAATTTTTMTTFNPRPHSATLQQTPTLTAVVQQPKPPYRSTIQVFTGATSTVATIGFVLSGGATGASVSMMRKISAINSMRGCPAVIDSADFELDSLGFDSNAFVLEIGEDDPPGIASYRGAAVGNFLATIVFAAVWLAILVLYAKLRKRNVKRILRLRRWPGFIFNMFVVFSPPTAMVAAVMWSLGPTPLPASNIVLGLAGIVLMLLVPGFGLFYLAQRAAAITEIEITDAPPLPCCGADMDADSKQQEKQKQQIADQQANAPCNWWRSVVAVGAAPVNFIFGSWVEYAPRKDQPLLERRKAQQFLDHLGSSTFDHYAKPYFAVVDFFVAPLVSILSGVICTTRQCCYAVSITTAIIALAHTVSMGVRPYSTRLDVVVNGLSALFTLVSATLLVLQIAEFDMGPAAVVVDEVGQGVAFAGAFVAGILPVAAFILQMAQQISRSVKGGKADDDEEDEEEENDGEEEEEAASNGRRQQQQTRRGSNGNKNEQPLLSSAAASSSQSARRSFSAATSTAGTKRTVLKTLTKKVTKRRYIGPKSNGNNGSEGDDDDGDQELSEIPVQRRQPTTNAVKPAAAAAAASAAAVARRGSSASAVDRRSYEGHRRNSHSNNAANDDRVRRSSLQSLVAGDQRFFSPRSSCHDEQQQQRRRGSSTGAAADRQRNNYYNDDDDDRDAMMLLERRQQQQRRNTQTRR